MNTGLVTCFAVAIMLAPGASRADPPFGKNPAYLAPPAAHQIVCQVADVTCLRVAAFIVETVKPWLADGTLVAAVNAQDTANAHITNLDIDKRDIAWIERSDKAAIDATMSSPAAKFLLAKKAAGKDAIIEIFAFDQFGLNVAQTDPTQDYNQGDEGKYWRTYMQGPGAIYIDIPRVDDGRNVAQASLTITDPATGKAIGAMTVGVDVDKLPKQ